MKFFLAVLILVVQMLQGRILDPLDPSYAWMDPLIEKEFELYAEGITREMLDEVEQVPPERWKWGRFSVVNGKVYGPTPNWGDIWSGAAVTAMLEDLIAHYSLPDVEFIYLLGDGLVRLRGLPGPCFVSAKHKEAKEQILFHDWYFTQRKTEPTWTQIHNWYALYQEVEACAQQIPWRCKIASGFWRGHPTDAYDAYAVYSLKEWRFFARPKLCSLSCLYPNKINAGLIASSPSLEFLCAELGMNFFKEGASLQEHMHYKYQICVDGYTCPYTGYLWRLLSDCCTLKQETHNIQWYYPLLQPWVHYVPIQEDLSDLVEKIDWLQAHDKKALEIAENARVFVKEHVMAEHIALYCYKVLMKYASLQKFAPEPLR